MISLLFNINFECFFEVLQDYWDEQIQLKEKSTWINCDSGIMLMEKAVEYKENFANRKEKQSKNKDEDLNPMISDNNKQELNKDKLYVKNNQINLINNITEKKENISLTQKTVEEIIRIKKYKKKEKEIFEESSLEEEKDNFKFQELNFKTKYEHKKINNLINLIRGFKNKILILVQNYFIKEILIKILSIEGFEVQNKECKQNKIYKFIKKNEKNSFVVLTHGEYKFSTDDYENIIFLSPNLGSIRKIEIMQSLNQEESTKVYSIIYKNSLEEIKLVNEIRNESECFKKLIEKNAMRALTKKETTIELEEEDDEDRDFIVLIDFREMRSNLPYFFI